MVDYGKDLQKVEAAITELRHALMGARERFGSGLQLTRTQLEVIMLLGEEPLTTGCLASKLFLTQSAITQTVSTMVRSGLILRTTSASDKRMIVLSCSPKGEKLASHIKNARQQHLQKFISQLSKTEIESLLSISKKLTSLLQENKEN